MTRVKFEPRPGSYESETLQLDRLLFDRRLVSTLVRTQ